ncbi:Integrase family protein [Candidatus Magnetomorum sp. HK-1]|nr:Integrase family protein [Candidatus Magnetomorum sp. HK-1]
MLMMEKPISDIKNHLGHEDIKSTMVYLKIDQSKRREVQKKYIEHMKQVIEDDVKVNDLIDWENSKDVLEWLDSF